MAVHFHWAGGLAACGLPLRKYLHTNDPTAVTCKRCHKVIPKVEQPRRIALRIASATATHCGGGCSFDESQDAENFCRIFGRRSADAVGTLRAPDCIAAEVK